MNSSKLPRNKVDPEYVDRPLNWNIHMPKLPRISGRECATALQKVGFRFVRQSGSSHGVYRRVDPFAQLTIPDHDELDRGTLRAIIRQAGLTVAEFVALL